MPKGLLLVWMEVPEQYEEEFHAWYDTEHVPQREAVPGFIFVRRFASADGIGPRFLATYLLEDPAVLKSPPYLAISYENVSPWSRRMSSKATYLHRNLYEEIGPRVVGNAVPGAPGDQNGYSGTALFLECAEVPPDCDADFNDWYDREHLPALLAISGVRAARRFRVRADEPQFVPHRKKAERSPGHPRYYTQHAQPRYVTLCELDDITVLASEAIRALGSAEGVPATASQWRKAIRTMSYGQIYPTVGGEV